MGRRRAAGGRVQPDERPPGYADLHSDAADLARELTAGHGVLLTRGSVADAASGDVETPALDLVPVRPGPAALTFVLTGLPGLEVRIDGRMWLLLPHCGCDACDETLDECREQLRGLIGAVVAGSLGERLYREEEGWVHEQWARHDGGAASRGRAGSAPAGVCGARRTRRPARSGAAASRDASRGAAGPGAAGHLSGDDH